MDVNKLSKKIVVSMITMSMILSTLPMNVSLAVSTPTGATSTSGDVFLGNSKMEVGINKYGSFGSVGNAPEGFHPWSGASNKIGMVSSDVSGNWGSTEDYFLPGTVDEGFAFVWDEQDAIQVKSTGCGSVILDSIAKNNYKDFSTSNNTNGNTLSAKTSATVADKVEYTQSVSFEGESAVAKIVLTMKNISDSALTNVKYVRAFDPDHGLNKAVTNNYYHRDEKGTVWVIASTNATPTGIMSFEDFTKNATSPFIFMAPKSDDYTVEATEQPVGWRYNSAVKDVTDSSTYAYGKSTYGDQGIGLRFYLNTIGAGETKEITYYMSLDSDIDSALKDLQSGNLAQQPESMVIEQDGTASISVDLETLFLNDENIASDTTFTYEWYVKDDENSEGTKIDGAIEGTYLPPTNAVGSKYYYCKVTPSNGSPVNTGVVRLEVTEKETTVKTYEITFNKNTTDDVQLMPSSQKVQSDQKALEPKAPIRAGYRHAGWYSDEDCKTPYDFNSQIKNNVTLHSKWELVSKLELTTDDSKSSYGDAVIFTASFSDGYKPTGNVTFSYGSGESKVTIGTVALSNGIASITTKDLPLMNSKDITVTYTGDSPVTNNSTSVKQTVVVKNAYLSIEDISDQSYTGSSVQPTITVNDGLTELILDTDYTVEYSNNINAGTATVKVTCKGNYSGSISKTFIISKADIVDKTATKSQSTTYNGEEQTPTIIPSGSSKIGSQTIIVKYSNDNGKTYTLESMPSFKDAETHTVYYQLSAPNHESVTGAIEYTINKFQLEWSKGIVSNKVYDANTNATVSTAPKLNTFEGDTVPTITVGTVTFENKNAGTDKKVTAIAYKVADSNNYLAPTEQPVFDNANITKRSILVTPTAQTSYYGEPINLSYGYTGVQGSDAVSIGGKVEMNETSVGVHSITKGSLYLPALDFVNYEIDFKDDVKYTITEYKPDASVASLDDWISADTVTLTAPAGFHISTSNAINGSWTDSVTVATDEGESQSVTYYLRNTKSGAISVAKTFNYNNDQSNPTGEIKIKTNLISKILNTITFNLFFKETVNVTITGEDELSGIKSIEYQKVESKDDYAIDGKWTTYEAFSVSPNEKFFIYARITDNAGNTIIINSDGVIVYTDSQQDTESFSFTKLNSDEDKTISVTLNGNTINTVSIGETKVDSSNYEIADDKITFKSGYLETLDQGQTVFTISYNPLGEEYVASDDSQVPGTTTVTGNIYDVITDTTGDNKSQNTVYDTTDQSPVTPTGTAVDQTITVKYSDDKGDSYTLDTIPSFKDAGTYTVCYELSAPNHVSTIGTITFEITKATPAVKAPVDASNTYNGKSQNLLDTGTTTGGTLVYSTSKDGAYSSTIPTGINAGEYTLYYKVVGDKNYKDVQSKDVTATIKQKDVTGATVGTFDALTYNASEQTPNASVTIDGLTATGTWSAVTNMEDTSTFTANGNFKGTIKDQSVGMDPKLCTEFIVTFDETSKVYDGTVFEPTFTVMDGDIKVSSDDYTVTYSEETSVGTKDVVITFNDPYKGAITKQVSIKDANIKDNTVTTQDTIYNATNQSATVPTGTSIKNQTITVKYSNDKGDSYTLDTIPSFKDAGTYTVYYELSAPNHKSTTGTIEYTIKPFQLEWNNGTVKDKVYNTNVNATVEKAPTLTTFKDDTTVPTITVGTVTFDNKNVDEDKVVTATGYEVADSNNYLAPTNQPVFSNASIEAKEVIVTPTTQTKYYGQDPVLTYTYTGNLEDVTFTGTISMDETVIGEYVISQGSLALDETNYYMTFDETVTYSIVAYKPTEVAVEPTTWLSASTVTVKAPEGFMISLTDSFDEETWKDSITLDTKETDSEVITYYLRNIVSKAISVSKSFTYKNDVTAPTGQIVMETSSIKKILNTITFNLFFKETVKVSVTSEDLLSGIKSVEYQKVASKENYDIDGKWTTYEAFSVDPNEKFYIYARITDNAGNTTVINSDGVIVYTDSKPDTESFSFTKQNKDVDKTITVTLNGNTINTVRIGETKVDSSNYIINGNVITFKSGYLETLKQGKTIFTISYNPLGEEYVENNDSQSPETTTVVVNIYDVITDKTAESQDTIYNATNQSATVPTGTSVNNQTITVKYSDDKGESYTLDTIPSFKDAGTYTVYYELSAPNHKSTTGTIEYTIKPFQLEWNNGTVKDKVYNTNVNATVEKAPTLTTFKDDTTVPTITVGTVTFDNKNVDEDKVVTATGYEVADSNNYLAPTNQPVFSNASIEAKEVIVTPTTQTKYYGQDPVLIYTYTGNLEDVTFTGTISMDETAIGEYKINQGSLALDETNYYMTFDETVTYSIVAYEPTEVVVEPTTWLSASTVTVTAPEGFMISLTDSFDEETWKDSITLDTKETDSEVITYYLRNIVSKAISVSKSFTYKNDVTAPTGTVTIDKTTWDKLLETISFGIYKPNSQVVTITSDDELSGVKDTQYYVTKDVLNKEDLTSITTWTEYDELTVDVVDGKHFIVYVKVTDHAGNSSYISSDGVLFDTTAPTIEGVKNFGFYKTDVKVSVTDTNLASVTVNGKTVESNFVLKANTDNKYTIVATDYAGNTTTKIVTMYAEKAPVDQVLDQIPNVEDITDEDREEIQNLTQEVVTNIDKETIKEDKEAVDILHKLDETFVAVNGNITVVSKKPTIESAIDKDKHAIITDVKPQGLAVAVYGSKDTTPKDNIELSLSIKQQVSTVDKLVFNVKPMVRINDEEPTVIPNDQLYAPVTFRLYLNNGFKGTLAMVEHVKEDGTIDVYENESVMMDSIGKYVEITTLEFSNFMVSEISYNLTIDGTTSQHKVGDIIELVIPTKEGYEFTGWQTSDITIQDGEFRMPQKDVTITSSWKEVIDDTTVGTGDVTSFVVPTICLVSSIVLFVVFKKKKED